MGLMGGFSGLFFFFFSVIYWSPDQGFFFRLIPLFFYNYVNEIVFTMTFLAIRGV